MAEEHTEEPQDSISSSSATAAIAAIGNGWSSLHPDVASNIIPRLDTPSFVCFLSVCILWHNSNRQHCLRCHPLTRTPRLLPHRHHGDEVLPQTFYSPIERKKYQISLYFPNMDVACHGIIESSNGSGLLIYVDDISNFNVINPLTGAHVHLPHNSAFPDHHTVFSVMPLHLTTMRKAIVVSHDQHHTTIAARLYSPFLNGESITFAKSGSTSWTVFIAPTYRKFHDIISHKGKIYAVYQTGKFAIFDLDRLSDQPGFWLLENLTFFSIVHLMESQDGDDLFLVVSGAKNKKWKHTGFTVFVLDEENWKWEKLKSLLDNLAMFIGHRIAFTLTVNQRHGLEGNCIYLTQNFTHYSLWVFHLRHGSMTQLLDHNDAFKDVDHWSGLPVWFVPSLI